MQKQNEVQDQLLILILDYNGWAMSDLTEILNGLLRADQKNMAEKYGETCSHS